jgi:hypothetical protein
VSLRIIAVIVPAATDRLLEFSLKSVHIRPSIDYESIPKGSGRTKIRDPIIVTT